MTQVFKICTAPEWAEALAEGCFSGSAADRADGFIHLSAAHQLRGTAERHFAGGDNLVLIAFAAESLAGLKWEPSRGGDLFPHVYGSLPTSLALWARPLPWTGSRHDFPAECGV
jgi:uncharacterized protein (DUF952 family)